MRSVAVWILILLFTLNSFAEEGGPSSMQPCRSQIDLFCAEERDSKDFRNLLRCLRKNEERLTPACKQEIQRFAKASQQTSPPGAGPLGALGSLMGAGAQVPALAYDGRYVPGRGARGPSLFENSLAFSVPVFKREGSALSLSVVGTNAHFDENVVLDSGEVLAHDFYRTEVGFQYSRTLSRMRNWGLRGSFGFTGDEFDSRTRSFSLGANYSFPGSASSRWVLMLLMSNNSSLGSFVPLPGFFYVYRTPTFTGIFGLPILSLQWTPVVPWSFSFSAFGPQLRSEVSYGAIDEPQFFTGAGWKQQRYIVAARVNENDRLSIDEKNVEVGMRKALFEGVFSEAAVGYAFSRSIYIGKGLFNHDRGKSELDANAVARWTFKLAF